AYPPGGEVPGTKRLPIGGEYQWRREGEPHLFDPETVFTLQHSTRNKRYDIFKRYTGRVNEQSKRLMTLRGLFQFKEGVNPPISVDEVEPISAIIKRFSTGAMSYGSVSAEVHETLAIAMNRIGGKSNTGEGGEEPERFIPMANGDSKRSAIKQVASGRFGVTSNYLVNSDDIQIKIVITLLTVMIFRLKSHRVQSLAKADSYQVTRCIHGSLKRVTRLLALD
ncbi:MAG: hypothetical protein RLZZ193_652, partial [Actinomycetota bacterium]